MVASSSQQKMLGSTPPVNLLPFTTTGTILLHIDFLLTGIVMTFLGPMLPILAVRWSISDEKSGALIFVQFFASMFGMLLSNTSVQRFGYRITLMIGLLLMSVGMVLLASGPYAAGIVSVGILGFGYGITTPAGNLRTAEIDPARSAAALNVINAVWGIGAMSSPFLFAIAQHAHRPRWFLFGTGAALVLLMIVLAASRFHPDSRAALAHGQEGEGSIWSLPVLPLICALFFVYVGTETSFGAWVATYAHRLSPSERTMWAVVPSFYWGALLVGRSIAPLVLKFRAATAVATGGLAISLLGATVLVLAQGTSSVMAGSLLAGLGLASIFPISVSLLQAWFGNSTRAASGVIFSSGNMGGAVFPWIVGVISTHAGSLRLGFFVPLIGVAAMFVFYLSGASLKQRTV